MKFNESQSRPYAFGFAFRSSSRFIQDSLFNMNMYHSGDNTYASGEKLIEGWTHKTEGGFVS